MTKQRMLLGLGPNAKLFVHCDDKTTTRIASGRGRNSSCVSAATRPHFA